MLRAHHDDSIAISAGRSEGLDRLEQAVREVLHERALESAAIFGTKYIRIFSFWRERDPATVAQVTEGFRRLYPS